MSHHTAPFYFFRSILYIVSFFSISYFIMFKYLVISSVMVVIYLYKLGNQFLQFCRRDVNKLTS
jgi:hypothetical protein